MATLVCFHAHPDDESSSTAGILAKSAQAGHRSIVVTATDGAMGEVHVELEPGETLAERRAAELAAALEVIGAEPPRMLGYADSGMMGDAANDNPDCFYQADIDEAAAKLAEILREVDADVLTIYDDHGGYGHPDHIQVHRVGLRAAEIAGIDHVYEVTMNRTRIQQMMATRREDEAAAAIDPTEEHLADHHPTHPVADGKSGAETSGSETSGSDSSGSDSSGGDSSGSDTPEVEMPDEEMMATIGTPETDISFVVDTTDQIAIKRAALACHASQMPPDNMFMVMPDEMFTLAFGYEHFNLPGRSDTGGPTAVDTLPGLEIRPDLELSPAESVR